MRRIFRNSVIWGQDDTATNNTVEDDDDDEGGPGVESDPIASLITSSSGSWPKRLNEFEENQSMASTCSKLVVSTYTSVNPIGFHANEDRSMYYQQSIKIKGLSQSLYVFGVLDGHDGITACELVASEFPKAWIDNSVNGDRMDTSVVLGGKNSRQIVEAATTGLKYCEKVLQTSNCSAGVCVLGNLLIGRYLYCGNLGDCRAAWIPLRFRGSKVDLDPSEDIVADGGIIWTSRDMKASATYERRRISQAGGNVSDGRVAGVLEPSRTIGDFDVKMKIPPDVISITPEVRCVDLLSTGRGGSEETREYGGFGLIMSATDGIWDGCGRRAIRRAVNESRTELCRAMGEMFEVNGKQQLDELERPRKTLQTIGKKMVTLARQAGSVDDCTCQVALVYAPPGAGEAKSSAVGES